MEAFYLHDGLRTPINFRTIHEDQSRIRKSGSAFVPELLTPYFSCSSRCRTN